MWPFAAAIVGTQLLGGYFGAEAGRQRTEAQSDLYGAEADAFRASALEARRLAQMQFQYTLQSGREQAAAIRERGELEQRYIRADGNRTLGAIRAAVGGSGAQFRGTALTVLANQAANTELDARTAEWNADQEAQMVMQEAVRGANLIMAEGMASYNHMLRQASLRDDAADAVQAGADEAWWATILGGGSAAGATGFNLWRSGAFA